MTVRLYFVPVVRLTNPIYRVPKYFWHAPSGYTGLAELQNVRQLGQLTHKLEGLYLLAANLDATQHAALAAQSDVVAIPDLDNSIPNIAVRDTVRDFLESVHTPAQWVIVGMDYRTILRIILGLWHYRAILQHCAGPHIFRTEISLNRTVGEMPPEIQAALADTANALNLDHSTVTGSTTIRQLLHGAGQQFAATQFKIGPVAI